MGGARIELGYPRLQTRNWPPEPRHGRLQLPFAEVCGKTDEKKRSTFIRTQQFIYSVSVQQHVSAQRAIIRLRMGENIQRLEWKLRSQFPAMIIHIKGR